MASSIDQISIKVMARRNPCLVWVVFPSTLVAVAATVLWLVFDEQLFLWVAAPQLPLLTYAYARTRRLHCAYLRALRGMQRSERRYVLVLRSFSERSAHERSYSTLDPSGLILHHMLTLIAPIEERCREMDMHCVVIGGGLVADAKVDDVVIYLDYPDGGWERAFRRLALGAAAIIVFPETSSALITEIEYLRDNGLLLRTAFVAPPKALPTEHVLHHDQVQFENRWNAVRSEFNTLGLDAPPLSSGGSLFELVPAPGGLWEPSISGIKGGLEGDWMDDTERFLASNRQGEPLGKAMQDPVTQGWRVQHFDPLDVPGGDVLLPALLIAVAMILFSSVLLLTFFFISSAVFWLFGVS